MTMIVRTVVEPWLARDEGKRERYCDDLYFWEGWGAFREICGERPADVMLKGMTFLLVKPEAIAGRRVAAIVGFLREQGFGVAGVWPVRMGRHQVRALWGYQLNVVPIAHVRALEMLAGSGELFLVGVRWPGSADGRSAAEALAARKSSPGGDGLRERLGCPTLMINFVHAPDEPADVLRELAVLGDAAMQRQIMRALLAAGDWAEGRLAGAARAAEALMTSRYVGCPAHDLDVAASLRRMRTGSGLPVVARAAIQEGMVPAERALEVVESLERATALPRWDRVVTAAYLVEELRTGRSPLVGEG